MHLNHKYYIRGLKKTGVLKRTFITNLALLLILNLLVKPFWIFGIDRTVQNMVGAESYGFYFVMFNFSLILNMLLDLGISNFNNRNISQNTQLVNKHLSNIIAIRVMLGVGYFVVTMLLAWLLHFSANQLKLLLLLTLNQFLLSFVLYIRSNLAGMQLFKTDSLISVLDRFIMILICGVLLWGNVTRQPFQIKWFVYAQTAAYLITALIALILLIQKTGRIRLNFDWNFTVAIIKKSLPYAILTLLMALYNRFDTVLLERMLPNGNLQAGIYAQAFRILDAATMFSLLFAGLLLPMFSRMIKLSEPIGQLTRLSFTLLMVPAILVVVVSIFFRHHIMELLYHHHVTESANLFAVLMSGYLAISTTYIFGTLLTANGSLKALNYMALAGMVVNVVLNVVLIPRYQAMGAAVSSLITQSLTALIQVILAIRLFKLRLNFKLLILLLIFASGVTLIGFVASHLPINWIISVVLVIVLGGALAFISGVIQPKYLYQILMNRE